MFSALCDRAEAAASCHRAGETIRTGVVRKDPETVHMVVFIAVSSFLTCVLLHQTGAQYSAVDRTRACLEMHIGSVAASHVVPAR